VTAITYGNLHALLDDAAADAPGAPAIRDQTGRWSYSWLAEVSSLSAEWLTAQGVSAGERVVVHSPNCRAMVAALFGCSRLGATFVPVNPRIDPFQLRDLLADCDPRIVLTADGMASTIRRITRAAVHELRSVCYGVDARTATQSEVSRDDITALIYTWGSTPAPEAVAYPEAQMIFAAEATHSVLRYQRDDAIFCQLPMSSGYGLHQLLLACLARAELIVTNSGPDISSLRKIRQAGSTVVPVVPSMASILIRLAENDPGPSNVRLIANTGAALPQSSIDALHRHFPGARVDQMPDCYEQGRLAESVAERSR
jgi:acyl-CoA synthetase (AMP-forming)/AMP-acid ligase II